MNYLEKGLKYMSKHPAYNATVHALGGIGIGILITHPLVDPHTLRWGLILLGLSLLGHLYAFKAK